MGRADRALGAARPLLMPKLPASPLAARHRAGSKPRSQLQLSTTDCQLLTNVPSTNTRPPAHRSGTCAHPPVKRHVEQQVG